MAGAIALSSFDAKCYTPRQRKRRRLSKERGMGWPRMARRCVVVGFSAAFFAAAGPAAAQPAFAAENDSRPGPAIGQGVPPAPVAANVAAADVTAAPQQVSEPDERAGEAA